MGMEMGLLAVVESNGNNAGARSKTRHFRNNVNGAMTTMVVIEV